MDKRIPFVRQCNFIRFTDGEFILVVLIWNICKWESISISRFNIVGSKALWFEIETILFFFHFLYFQWILFTEWDSKSVSWRQVKALCLSSSYFAFIRQINKSLYDGEKVAGNQATTERPVRVLDISKHKIKTENKSK